MTEEQKKFRRALGRIIREELRTVLPEVLSEMYLKKLVESQAPARVKTRPAPQSLAAQLMEDEDPIPEPQQTQHRGIYEPIGDPDDDRNQARAKLRTELAAKMGVDAELFEGVSTEEPVSDGVPLGMFNFDKAMQLDEELKRDAENRAPMQSDPNAKLREIEMRRKMLDVPASQARGLL